MRLIIDANIFFSALLKNSTTRRIIFNNALELYSPRFLLTEFAKYHDELQARSKMTPENFNALASLILSRIKLIPELEIAPFLPAAEHLTVDEKDVPYIACALAVNAEIWSHDPHLQQKRVKRWITKEVANYLGYI